MIIEYHRPDTLEEALRLLARPAPRTLPLGGGAALNRPSQEPLAVVDLQSLGLDGIRTRGVHLELGATVTLLGMLESQAIPEPLKRILRLEAGYNLRQVSTVAGTLVATDGRSPLATALLALDTRLTIQPGEEELYLGDMLPLRAQLFPGRLITRVLLSRNAGLAYDYIARTPADRPLVSAAVVRWPSGRTRVALGGFGDAPILAFDGPDEAGAEVAAREAFRQAGDSWASAEFRQEMAGTLTRRALASLMARQNSG